MNDTLDKKPATSFWVIGAAALIWNLIGLFAYYGQVTMGEEALARMTDAQRQYFMDIPVWATSAFALAVTTGVLGSILLLLRKSVAVPVFVLSLVAVLVQNLNGWVLSDGFGVLGTGPAVISAIVIAVAIALVFYSRKAKSSGVLS